MEVLASPRGAVTWVCPDCGHGSPEPRDQQAHLDAHRQLRRFLDDWDTAAAADMAAERRRRRRPLVLAAVALAALALLFPLILRGAGRADPVSTRSTGPVPGVDLPRYGSATAVEATGPAPAPEPPGPATSEAGAAGSTPATPGATVVPGAAASARTPQQRPAPAGTEPAPAPPTPAPEATVPADTGTPADPAVVVKGCLLVVCLDIPK